MLYTAAARPRGRGWGGPSNLAVLFALLKKRTDNHSSVAKLRIRHVRAFVLSVCVHGVAACASSDEHRERERKKKDGTEGEKKRQS